MYFRKPVIATGYSGNVEFMREDNSCLVPYELVPVPDGTYVHTVDQVWAEPNIGAGVACMARIVDDRRYRETLGQAASRHVRTNFNYRVAGLRYMSRIAEIMVGRRVTIPSRSSPSLSSMCENMTTRGFDPEAQQGFESTERRGADRARPKAGESYPQSFKTTVQTEAPAPQVPEPQCSLPLRQSGIVAPGIPVPTARARGEQPESRNTSTELTDLRELPDDLWGQLMLRELVLPPLPPVELQRSWCANAGPALATQSAEFYSLVKRTYQRYGMRPFGEIRLLDFGCGWGRLIRLFAKDLPASQLFGCDSDSSILEWCKAVPGTFRKSESGACQLPFTESFELAFAFSVFTHLGFRTHEAALTALHGVLGPSGLLVVTVRPRAFLEMRGLELTRLPDAMIHAMLRAYDAGEYVYGPYNLPPVKGEIPYGDAVIPLSFIKNRWGDRFEIIEVAAYRSDPYQIPIILRRR
jgi:SAM-dependent methyltransferase